MPILAPTSTVAPAIPSVTYDLLHLKSLTMNQPNPNGAINVVAIVHKCVLNKDGVTYTESPVDTDIGINIGDLGAFAVDNPTFATTITTLHASILQAVVAIGVAAKQLS